MPDFSPFRRKRRAIPEKGLARDLYETKRDIRRAKRGEETEASMAEMKETKRRIKKDMREADKEERDAMIRQLDPLQLAPPRQRQTITST